MKKKVVLMVPGFKEYPSESIYTDIADLYSAKNIEPVILKIEWSGRLMSEYIEDFIQEFRKHDDKDVYAFGFSFGAMATFIASSQISLTHQLLCSTSPYFLEDLPRIEKERKSWVKGVGVRRMQDFRTISRKEIGRKVKAKTDLLVGTVEGDIMMYVTKAIYSDLPSEKHLEIIKGAGHDISHQKYLEAIKEKIFHL